MVTSVTSAAMTSRRLVLVVLGVGGVVAAAAAWVNPWVFQFYGDANSRLVQTRMLVDSVSPGLHWIGSVWLPLPGLLFLPFSLVDALFYSGLAGLIVCLPLLAWMTVLLQRLLLRLTNHPVVSTGVALGIALNPNMLYVSMTAMTETVTLFCVVAAIERWVAWLDAAESGRDSRSLVIASLYAAGATLCRYEAWPWLVVAAAGLVLVAWRRRGVWLVSLSGMGMAAWMAWNGSQYGDPLHFHRAEYYSAAWQALHRDVRQAYYLQVWNSVGIYATTMVAVFGWGWLAAALGGSIAALRRRPLGKTMFLLAVLLAMPMFTLVSLYSGVAEMTRWWNSRYVLLLSPFVAVTSALALAWVARLVPGPRVVGAVIAALWLVTTGWQALWQPGRVVTVADAAGGFYYRQSPSATEVGQRLRADWSGGQVLLATGSGQSHRIMQPSWIALRHFETLLNHDVVHLSLDRYAWIVVGLEPAPDGAEAARIVAERLAHDGGGFQQVYANEYYVVYRR